MMQQPFWRSIHNTQYEEPLPDIVKLPANVKHILCDIICDTSSKDKSCPFYRQPESYESSNGNKTNCWRWAAINEMQLLMIKIKYKVSII